MLQFTWHDGSLKYLHVDVHLIEDYQVNTCMYTATLIFIVLHVSQVRVEEYISMVQQRLNWLTSGSRAPFGVISEKKCRIFHVISYFDCLLFNSVLLLVECSAATLPYISQLQNNLHLLLSEQLSHTERFNIMRLGM